MIIIDFWYIETLNSDKRKCWHFKILFLKVFTELCYWQIDWICLLRRRGWIIKRTVWLLGTNNNIDSDSGMISKSSHQALYIICTLLPWAMVIILLRYLCCSVYLVVHLAFQNGWILLLLEKFFETCTKIVHSPVHSKAVINYAMAICLLSKVMRARLINFSSNNRSSHVEGSEKNMGFWTVTEIEMCLYMNTGLHCTCICIKSLEIRHWTYS